ncbi:helix-turn-helix domain-containing protein [Arcobacter porcinus]|uniref:helix-turn-helix domain-containing protein n=1 Tax=Arcobacter porcinus TaxID=1935204 RepID=UPI00081E73D2|nr:helix-turn-helix transcriptional regulator [Arcobacter porcinus]OCL81892.1 Helix-turn-helix domain protein [Arcobacter porcinus]
MNINSNLIDIRKKLGLNQMEFADRLETSQNLISKYEQGKVELPFKIINNLNKVFNININWLLTGNGSMFENEIGNKENILFKDEIINDIQKLSPKRQEYYYHKIKADLIEEELAK